MDFVGDIGDVFMYADFFKKGLPPVQGGVLDQAINFLVTCEEIWSLQNYYKHKLMALDE